MTKDKLTRIPVMVSTRNLLKTHGLKGDTYDKIILRLLDKANGVKKC